MDDKNRTTHGINVDFRLKTLNDLTRDLGFSDLSREKQDELGIRMSEALLKSIFLQTMERLGTHGREEYRKMMQSNVDPGQVEVFFRERIHKYDEMVKDVIEEFKAEMMRIEK